MRRTTMVRVPHLRSKNSQTTHLYAVACHHRQGYGEDGRGRERKTGGRFEGRPEWMGISRDHPRESARTRYVDDIPTLSKISARASLIRGLFQVSIAMRTKQKILS